MPKDYDTKKGSALFQSKIKSAKKHMDSSVDSSSYKVPKDVHARKSAVAKALANAKK